MIEARTGKRPGQTVDVVIGLSTTEYGNVKGPSGGDQVVVRSFLAVPAITPRR